MARIRKTVKIDNAEYQFKELTVEEIIELTTGSQFFSDKLKGAEDKQTDEKNEGEKKPDLEESLFDFLVPLSGDLKRIVEKSCDFKVEDLKKHTPSEIKQLYEAFEEVNKSFFDTIKVLGITEALTTIKEVILDNFSRMLVTLLNQDT